MEARYTTPQQLFEGSKQFVVPLFQRTYSWTEKQWATLWDDLLSLLEAAPERLHFIGSLVMLPTNTIPAGVNKFAVIDGQQRLTTLAVLLLALRDTAPADAPSRLRQLVNQEFLTNTFATEEIERYKILPARTDREAFQLLCEACAAQPLPPGAPALHKAYAFFCNKITKWKRDHTPDAKPLLDALLKRFSLVSITLDDKDDPYLVFESLNAKGLQLTAADLIRNYLFMKLPQGGAEQESHNRHYWEPMQQQLGERMTDFIWHHLLMRQGGNLRQTEVYLDFKRLAAGQPVEQVLRELSEYAPFYARLLHPELETARPAVRLALARLERLRFTVAYPLVLRLYRAVAAGAVAEATLLEVLGLIENYVLRRFITGRGTQGANRSFQTLTKATAGLETDAPALLTAMADYLTGQNYPTDEQVFDALLNKPLYHDKGERLTRTKLLLHTLEAGFNLREVVGFDTLTIEHILPQSLTDAWRAELGHNAEGDHAQLLHTLGNLTLTGWNSELSNSAFAIKKSFFQASSVSLSADLVTAETWNRAAILARGQRLAQRVLDRWPSFAAEGASAVVETRTAKKPLAVRLQAHRVPVGTWREAAAETLKACAAVVGRGLLQQLGNERPHHYAQRPDGFRSPLNLGSGWYYEGHNSANGHQRNCLFMLAQAGLSPTDWQVETASEG